MSRQVACRSTARLVLLGCLIALTGCSSRGTITGKVTHKGKPVVWGTVSVVASDNMAYSGQITPQGTYTIENVPTGPVKIGVTSPNPDGTTRGGPAARNGGMGDRPAESGPKLPPGAWQAIPFKYADPIKSGLTGKVDSSSTTINLDLP